MKINKVIAQIKDAKIIPLFRDKEYSGLLSEFLPGDNSYATHQLPCSKLFSYAYLPSTNLLETLAIPNGIDLTKNICKVFGPDGYIRSTYTYTPFGSVTAEGDVTQPIQWSSEFHDEELGLIYYNYRHYNPQDGRWINRDPIGEAGGMNLYALVCNKSLRRIDVLGHFPIPTPNDIANPPEMYKFHGDHFHIGMTMNKFIRWLLGQTPKISEYDELDEETKIIKDSMIGKDLEFNFKSKNKDAKCCNDWKNYTDYAFRCISVNYLYDNVAKYIFDIIIITIIFSAFRI